MLAALRLNFLVVPVVVFGLTRFLPQEPVILVGASMVLLTPYLERLNAEFYYLWNGVHRHHRQQAAVPLSVR